MIHSTLFFFTSPGWQSGCNPDSRAPRFNQNGQGFSSDRCTGAQPGDNPAGTVRDTKKAITAAPAACPAGRDLSHLAARTDGDNDRTLAHGMDQRLQ